VFFSGEFEIFRLAPEVRGKISVGVGQSVVGSLQEVTSSSGATTRRGVDILDTGELQNLLGDRCSNDTSSSRSWDESDTD